MTEKSGIQLDLLVTEDRLRDLDLETFYYVDTNPRAMLDFVAHFVVGEDQETYLEKEQAIKLVITGRKIADIEALVESLKDSMELSTVPNE
jgi:hypothetical protein